MSMFIIKGLKQVKHHGQHQWHAVDYHRQSFLLQPEECLQQYTYNGAGHSSGSKSKNVQYF